MFILNMLNLMPELMMMNSFFMMFTYAIFYKKLYSYLSLVMFFLFFAMISICMTFTTMDNKIFLLSFNLMSDTLSDSVKILLLSMLMMILLTSISYLKAHKYNSFELIFLFIMSMFSAMLLVSVNDFFLMFIAMELQSLCFYILASFNVNSNFSVEAGLKYFMLGSAASGLLLFGMSLMYGLCGTTNFGEFSILFKNFSGSQFNLLIIALVFMLVGLLFKLGAAPFHGWLPDVYEGAPLMVTFYFITIPKMSFVVLLSSMFNLLSYSFCDIWSFMCIICAMVSLFMGTFGALYQTKIKSLLAYSTMSHIAFILFALSIHSINSYFSLYFYMYMYMFILIGLFSFLIIINSAMNFSNFKKMSDLRYLFFNSPFLSFLLLLSIFSSAGIPPLSGFFSKLLILFVLIENKMFFIAFLIMVLTMMTAIYYLRLIHFLWFKIGKIQILFLKNLSFLQAFFLFNFLIFNLIFFSLPMTWMSIMLMS